MNIIKKIFTIDNLCIFAFGSIFVILIFLIGSNE